MNWESYQLEVWMYVIEDAMDGLILNKYNRKIF